MFELTEKPAIQTKTFPIKLTEDQHQWLTDAAKTVNLSKRGFILDAMRIRSRLTESEAATMRNAVGIPSDPRLQVAVKEAVEKLRTASEGLAYLEIAIQALEQALERK